MPNPNDPGAPAAPAGNITDADRDKSGNVKTGVLFNTMSDKPNMEAPQVKAAQARLDAAQKKMQEAEKGGTLEERMRARGAAMQEMRDARQNMSQAVQSTISHDYAVRTEIEGIQGVIGQPNGGPEALNRVNEVADRFRGPVTDALDGKGHNPDQLQAKVDPKAPGGLIANGFRALHGPESGGHVDMYKGTTPDGRAWAQNSTREGEHPLIGHIVRTVQYDDKTGKYYMLTRGTGQGHQGHTNGAARHFANTIVGPPTFQNLDAAMNRSITGDTRNTFQGAP